ncbi:MAG: NUDIX domain-containing protein [Planctomycetota bacterium]
MHADDQDEYGPAASSDAERAPSAPLPPCTHAGGVVWRRLSGGVQFLLVRPTGHASGAADEWLLPKGHIERGESTEDAALREVLEEAGAVVELGELAGALEYEVAGKPVRCAFYSMELRGQRESQEGRGVRWASLADVRTLVPFADTVALVERVARALD